MSLHTVRVSFPQPGFSTPTHRHYPIYAETPEKALEIVAGMKPYCLSSVLGVVFGHPMGSKFEVMGTPL